MKKINYLDTIKSPVITEKATGLSELNKVVFKVHEGASKHSIKKNIYKSVRNIPDVKLINHKGTNVYDLIRFKNVLFTKSSIKNIEQRLINEKN